MEPIINHLSSRSLPLRPSTTTWSISMSDMSASLDLRCSSILNSFIRIGLSLLVRLLTMLSRVAQLSTESNFMRILCCLEVALYSKALIRDSKIKYRTSLIQEWPNSMPCLEVMTRWKPFALKTWYKDMQYGLEEVCSDLMMPLEDTKHARCTKSMDLKFAVTTQSSKPLSCEKNLQ